MMIMITNDHPFLETHDLTLSHVLVNFWNLSYAYYAKEGCDDNVYSYDDGDDDE